MFLNASGSVAKDKYVNNLLLSFKLSSVGFSSSSIFSFSGNFLFVPCFLVKIFFSGSSFFQKSKGIFNLPGRILFLSSSDFCFKLSKGFLSLPGIGRVSSSFDLGESWNLSSFIFPGIILFLVYNPLNFFPFLSKISFFGSDDNIFE